MADVTTVRQTMVDNKSSKKNGSSRAATRIADVTRKSPLDGEWVRSVETSPAQQSSTGMCQRRAFVK